jgi:hypothetical protein
MAEMQLDIDAIVREVVRRLQRAQTSITADKKPSHPVGPGRRTGPGAPTDDRAQTGPADVPGVLQVDHRVVTMTVLEGRLNGIKQLVVPPGAVVTPSVRDVLRKKRVELVFADPTPCAGSANGSPGFAVAVLAGDASTILRSVLDHPQNATRVESNGLVDAVAQLTDAVADGSRLALLLTSQPALALCLANRRRGVRAVWGVNAVLAAEATACVGANLLVVDPGKGSLHEVRSMLKQFLQSGVRPCPTELAADAGAY